MNLQEWRALRLTGEDALLPSGLTVKLKAVGLMDLMLQGDVPAPLLGKVEALIQGDEATLGSVEEFAKYADMVNLVCKAAIVEPEDLDVKELPMMDRLQIFNWANSATSGLKLFRGQQRGPMESVLGSDHVRPEAQRRRRPNRRR